MSNKTVIIGGVAAGASCAARLRRLDEKAQIVMLERGPYISYANCGLPYHVGDVIKERGALLLQTPEVMKARFNIDVRVGNEVISIDRNAKKISVKKVETGEIYEEAYDNLVIATGSSPLRPPIPGIESERIKTLWTVPDTDHIRNLVRNGNVKKTAVIGGGFIGLEMAENLKEAGMEVTLIEAMDQVMAPLDYEMALLLHDNIRRNGTELILSDGVNSFEDNGRQVTIHLESGKFVQADLVILSIGVRPNSQLAKDAGLELNERGGIKVDSFMKTSDDSIYVAGDAVEVTDFVFGDKTMIPLAGPANKQGRIVADNIAGLKQSYDGSLGTSVAKVFDLTAAATGANEKALRRRGMEKGKDYETLTITQNSHAGYYPGAMPLTLKLIFAKKDNKILGAQIVGYDGVDKRIDTIATTMRLKGDVLALKTLELAYAPPYSSAKDPVNMAGFVAENVIRKMVSFSDWDVKADSDTFLLDVRESEEVKAYSIPHALNIPLGQLRSSLNKIETHKNKRIVVFCAIGVRAYNASRILQQNGFENVLVYPGGARFYQSTHRAEEVDDSESDLHQGVSDMGDSISSKGSDDETCNCNCNTPTMAIQLNCTGLQCPGPIMKVFEAIKEMDDGEVVEVRASDPGFARDIESWCKRTGNTLCSNTRDGKDFVACIRKGVGKGGRESPLSESGRKVVDTPNGKTIIVFSGDLDKVLASFIIANGAAAMGRKVTMFFTFWGLTALRKSQKQSVKKSFMESMFGAMLPRGTGNLKLSKMNMGGMGTAMMKKIMNDKNVDSLEDLMKKAMANGVSIIACTMSMDVMGIRKEELIDGVELGGVGTYLGEAEESNVNLFI